MCVLVSNRTTGWEGNRSGYKRAVPGVLVMIGLFRLAAVMADTLSTPRNEITESLVHICTHV